MISKHVTYQIKDDDTLTQVRLKKWSVTKFVSLLRDVGDLLKLLGDDFRLDLSVTPSVLADYLVRIGSAAVEKLNRVIAESVDDPKLTTEAIGEFSGEDYLGILIAIFEQNFTDEIRKNFSSLKNRFGGVADFVPPKTSTTHSNE